MLSAIGGQRRRHGQVSQMSFWACGRPEGSFEWTIECLGLSQEQTSASAALMSQSDPKRTSSDLPDPIKLKVGENAHHIRMADNDLPREASLAKWNSF